MADKKWIISFKLKELSASHYWQSATVEASNVGLAVNRAWAEVKGRPNVKGRRVTKGEISFELIKGDSNE